MTKREWLKVYEYDISLDLDHAEKTDPNRAVMLRDLLRMIQHSFKTLSDDELDEEI